MGFDNRTGGKYFTILGGKFCLRVPEGTAGAVARTNKVNKLVHEVFHDSFTGKLIGLRIKPDNGYGKSWEFDFKDGAEIWTLQLSFSNSYATNILKILPNANLTQEMKIQPSQKIEDGKTKSSLFISQNGVTLKHAFTKDNPNGMPPMVKVMVKGSEVWDDSDRLVFFEKMVNERILPMLPKQEAAQPAANKLGSEDEADATFDAMGEAGSDDDF